MATAYRWVGEGRDPNGKEYKFPGHELSSRAAKPQLLPKTISTESVKKPAMVEFYTVKRIDNSRLVRRVEPVKLRNLYKTVALGGIIAFCCMLYIYQHFHCIDLSFQLEELKGKKEAAQVENNKMKLAIAYLRDPRRIDVIARHQLGLTQPTATQVREYAAVDGEEVAAVRDVRVNHAP